MNEQNASGKSWSYGDWSGLSLGKQSVAGVRTLTEAVTLQLRDSIIRGQLRPGQPLWQDGLAEQFGVSRVPIREALRQLAAEGLVRLKSHHSAIVAELSVEEMEELYMMIVLLESAAARDGVPRLTEQDLKQMSDLLARMKAPNIDPTDWYLLNGEFHRILIVAAGRRRITHVIDECRRNVMRYMNNLRYFQGGVQRWNRGNSRILAACRHGDIDTVCACLQEMGTEVARDVAKKLRAAAE